jgi:hypothetical protein
MLNIDYDNFMINFFMINFLFYIHTNYIESKIRELIKSLNIIEKKT